MGCLVPAAAGITRKLGRKRGWELEGQLCVILWCSAGRHPSVRPSRADGSEDELAAPTVIPPEALPGFVTWDKRYHVNAG